MTMIHDEERTGVADRQSVYITRDLLKRARENKINISEACRQGIEDKLNGKSGNLKITQKRFLNEKAITSFPLTLHVDYRTEGADVKFVGYIFRRMDMLKNICSLFVMEGVIRYGKITQLMYYKNGYFPKVTPDKTDGMAELMNFIRSEILNGEENPKTYGFSEDVEIQGIINLIMNEYEFVLDEA